MDIYNFNQTKSDYKLFTYSSDKEVKVFRNGDTSNSCEIRIPKNYSYAELADEIQRKLKLANLKKFRLFNAEGVEIFKDDIEFISDKSSLYASKGEDFDPSSSFSEYEIVKQLGQGGFGKVVLAIHRKTKDQVAIKTVNGNVGNAKFVDMVFAEAEVLKALKHKHIVKLHQCFTLKNMNIVFIMEYLEGGELGHYLKTKVTFDEEEAKFFFSQIADAMYYCHGEKLIHRDLKLENILLTSLESRNIKIVDFGIAGVSSNFNAETTEAGTLRYMPPEVVSGKLKVIDPSFDIWSMGCILYQFLHGVPPFDGRTKKEIIDKIKAGEYKIELDVERSVSRECIDLLKRMLDIDFKTRINIADVVSHPWLMGTKLEEEEKIEEIPTTPDMNNSVEVVKKRHTISKASNLMDTITNNSNHNNNRRRNQSKGRSPNHEEKKDTPLGNKKRFSTLITDSKGFPIGSQQGIINSMYSSSTVQLKAKGKQATMISLKEKDLKKQLGEDKVRINDNLGLQ